MKILSPAGNFESLKLAVFNGADEVYLGINEFNARNNIDGFTLENLGEAVDFCHVYGVKVCLAINILFSNEELEKALSITLSAFNLGVDYFIVQDLGLAYLISKNIPKAVLHASTQMAIHNLEGAKALIPYGFKRIVLARETPIEEIKRIKHNTHLELEYFSHGALCVSFSGNCYLSSYLNNASGNRGRCKQLCRLPYKLYFEEKCLKSGYLLSAKDFDLSSHLEQLQSAGVDVVKIEGRARRPFYVATVTNEYKKVINGLNANKTNFQLAFNRGFTPAYFNGNGEIISSVQNHVGIYIGKITKVIRKKTYNEVYFNSNINLNAKSTFKTFSNGEEKAVLTAYDLKCINGKNYLLTTTANISAGQDMHLIVDFDKEKQALDYVKKVNVKLNILLKENCPITAKFSVNNKEYCILGEVLSVAKNSPITLSELTDNFKKNEYFEFDINAKIDGQLFIRKQMLNEFRRNVVGAVFSALTTPFYHNEKCEKLDIFSTIKSLNTNPIPLQDFVVLDDYKELKNIAQTNVIYSPEFYDKTDIEKFIFACKNLSKRPILDLPNFALEKDIIMLKDLVESLGVCIVVNNYYALDFNTQKIYGAGLNIYNDITKYLLGGEFITAEANFGSKFGYYYMTLRHCPYKNHINANCNNCPHKNGYYLKMQNGKKLYIKRKKLSTCTFYLTD